MVELWTTKDFWNVGDVKVVREVDTLQTAVNQSHRAHLADGNWRVQPQFSEVICIWKSIELLCVWPLFQHFHDAVLNGAIPAFLIYWFAHQYLLLLVEQHYLFVLVLWNFMKKGDLLLRMLGFFVDLLLDKLQWPDFAPLCVLLLCGWVAKWQLFNPFLCY